MGESAGDSSDMREKPTITRGFTVGNGAVSPLLSPTSATCARLLFFAHIRLALVIKLWRWKSVALEMVLVCRVCDILALWDSVWPTTFPPVTHRLDNFTVTNSEESFSHPPYTEDFLTESVAKRTSGRVSDWLEDRSGYFLHREVTVWPVVPTKANSNWVSFHHFSPSNISFSLPISIGVGFTPITSSTLIRSWYHCQGSLLPFDHFFFIFTEVNHLCFSPVQIVTIWRC